MPGPIERVIGRLPTKLLIAIPLAYLAYLTLQCPCKPALLCCHLTMFNAVMALVLMIALFENGFNLMDTCTAEKAFPPFF